jgi:phosphoribosylanthranilate isomerase
MRDAENIHAVSQLGVDLIGLIFYPKSPRYVRMISSHAGIIPDYSEQRLHNICEYDSMQQQTNSSKSDVHFVGVFVDEMPQNIIARIYNYNLDYVQLHGNESVIMIDNLRRTVDPDIKPGLKIIKAISIEKNEDIDKYKEYEGHVDLFLFDTKCTTVGGSGEQFDWSVLSRYAGNTPFLLSGGIGPDDAERILAFHHPKCVGIDLNSRFETAPAVKDVNALKKFISSLTHPSPVGKG